MNRRVLQPELLDELPADDPLAVHSRRDLQRVNRWMRHARFLAGALSRLSSPPRHIVEIGCGDGSLLADTLARFRLVAPLTIDLIDRQPVVQPDIMKRLQSLGATVNVLQTDVHDWLESSPQVTADVVFANLFLHHFDDPQLKRLFAGLARRTRSFVACEPRRSTVALTGARLLGLIGCNRVTRHDAVISVRAGFRDRELTELWPAGGEQVVHEQRVGLFSHGFIVSPPSQ